MKKVVAIAIAAAAIAFWIGRSDRGRDIAFDRLWVDHLPRGEHDVFRLFFALTEQPVGVFNAQSAWKGEWEAFRYQARKDGELDIVFPSDQLRAHLRYRAWKCDEGEFAYCLELAGGRVGAARKYYSREEWEIGSVEAARAMGDKLAR